MASLTLPLRRLAPGTCCGFSLDPILSLAEDNLWLLDLSRKQADPRDWVEALCDLIIKWKPIGWAEEHVQIASGIGPYLESRQRVRRAGCARETFPTRGDKSFRAQSIRGRMALTGLQVPVDCAWYPAFRAELLGFPAGKHDDAVDALPLAGQLLDLMIPPKLPERERPKPKIRDWFDDEPEDSPSWKVL